MTLSIDTPAAAVTDDTCAATAAAIERGAPVRPYRTFAVRLARRERLGPSFVRITLTGEDLDHCADTLLDQRVKLLLGPEEGLRLLDGADDWYAAYGELPDHVRPAMRTYTLTAVRPAGAGRGGEVDIEIAVHAADAQAPAGPGMRFALEAPLGTPVALVAPDRHRDGCDSVGVAWHPGTARDLVLAGDETALPALANILTTLPHDVTGTVHVEVPTAQDVRSLDAPDGLEVRWCVRERGERVEHVFGRARADEDAEDLLWDEAGGQEGRYGWVAGEAAWVRRLRAEARAARVPRGQVSFMGYWRRGRAAVA